MSARGGDSVEGRRRSYEHGCRPVRIILARHGKPLPIDAGLITGRDLDGWIRRYDDGGIQKDVPPPEALKHLAASISCILASDLERSVQSAVWLAAGRQVRIEQNLREAYLARTSCVAIRLPPRAWVVIARLAWMLNCLNSTETAAATRVRARNVATQLSALGNLHGSVLVIGHGIFNRMLAKQLRASGWRGPRCLPLGYWSYASFHR